MKALEISKMTMGASTGSAAQLYPYQRIASSPHACLSVRMGRSSKWIYCAMPKCSLQIKLGAIDYEQSK